MQIDCTCILKYSQFAFRLYPAQTQSQTESDAKRIHSE